MMTPEFLAALRKYIDNQCEAAAGSYQRDEEGYACDISSEKRAAEEAWAEVERLASLPAK